MSPAGVWGERTRPVFGYFFFLSGRCVSADAAAVFAAFEDLGLVSTFDAAEAAFRLVTSLLALRAIVMLRFERVSDF